MCMVGHGLPQGSLVWIFSPKEIFYPRYMMETIKERPGEPYCKPDPHMWMEINLTAEGKAKPRMCYIYSFSTVAKKISWFEHCWMTQQIFFFYCYILRQFHNFSSVCFSVNMQGEVVPRSGSWNFPSSAVLLLLSFFSCFFGCRSQQICGEVGGGRLSPSLLLICPG